MYRVKTIIDGARDTLADPEKERWSDARLIRLVDEGQKLINSKFELMRSEVLIPMEVNQSMYSLPSDLIRITRCSFDNQVVDMFTYDEMDKKDYAWMTNTGPKLEAVIFNNRNWNEIRIYPLPDENYVESFYSIPNVFGVTTVIDDLEAEPELGVVVNIATSPGDIVNFTPSVYGVIADVSTLGLLKINYTRMTKDIFEETDDLELGPMFDTALKFYTIAHAFMDDLDAEYQSKGERALAMFSSMVEQLGQRQRTSSGTRATNHRTSYRGFI